MLVNHTLNFSIFLEEDSVFKLKKHYTLKRTTRKLDAYILSATFFTTTDLHDWMQYANITTQIGIILLIVLSLILKKKGHYVWHGNLMLLAVVINAITLLAHMGPSLIYLPDEPWFVTILGIIHAIIGSVTVVLGFWIAVPWAFGDSKPQSCATKRKHMKNIMIFWIVAFVLGIIFYVFHTAFE